MLACGSFAAGAIFLAGLMQTNGCCLQIADEIVSENSTCLATIPNLSFEFDTKYVVCLEANCNTFSRALLSIPPDLHKAGVDMIPPIPPFWVVKVNGVAMFASTSFTSILGSLRVQHTQWCYIFQSLPLGEQQLQFRLSRGHCRGTYTEFAAICELQVRAHVSNRNGLISL